jgi:nitrogen fixation protein FixH
MISQDNKQAMRNPWVLGWLGLLITVVVVNVIFIVTAFRTNPGLVDQDYYEKGRYHDNNYQKKLETRNRLGWRVAMQTPEQITLGNPGNFSVTVNDRVGQPLKGATVALHAYRPSDSTADIKTELEPVENADGVFQSKIALPLKGIWDINITVSQGEESLENSRRINVVAN